MHFRPAELGAQLRKALEQRNDIAHRGLLLSLEEQRDVAFLGGQSQRQSDRKRLLDNRKLRRLVSVQRSESPKHTMKWMPLVTVEIEGQ